MISQHDATAIRIAEKYGVEFNRGPGPDVITPNMDIEVETVESVSDAFRYIRSRKPVYVAGVDDFTTRVALQLTHDYTIGVMDQDGNIRRHSTR